MLYIFFAKGDSFPFFIEEEEIWHHLSSTEAFINYAEVLHDQKLRFGKLLFF